MLAQGGYLPGKRTDQILPPGMAGFRDAKLYPEKGADSTTAKKFATGPPVTAPRALHVQLRHRPQRAQIV